MEKYVSSCGKDLKDYGGYKDKNEILAESI